MFVFRSTYTDIKMAWHLPTNMIWVERFVLYKKKAVTFVLALDILIEDLKTVENSLDECELDICNYQIHGQHFCKQIVQLGIRY